MRKRAHLLFASATAAIVLLSASSAFADGVGSVATADEQTHLMSITISPMHLIMPVVELTGEFKAADQWGVAVVGGFGSITQTSKVSGDTKYDVWEAGAQLRYYLLGNFDHGMQLGAEAIYASVSNDHIQTSAGSFSSSADGLSAGPFIGYKIATDIGFTFDAQLGVQAMGIGASAKHEQSGTSATASGTDWGPLLNLNLGWSF